MPDPTKVAPIDPSQETSPLMDPEASQETLIMDGNSTQCVWNGQVFNDADVVECDGVRYECGFGRWVKS